jgi:hypothetical protein
MVTLFSFQSPGTTEVGLDLLWVTTFLGKSRDKTPSVLFLTGMSGPFVPFIYLFLTQSFEKS